MKPTKLYIENFMCYGKSFIDFTKFNTALIVGKVDNNDLYSNGVGKTTIFKAIEYVLFNQSDVNLDRIIRDDEAYCRVIIDFLIGDQEYRVSRSRTKKGSNDLILLQRNSVLGEDDQVYHIISQSQLGDIHLAFIDKKDVERYWKDLSASRTSDTEKELAKLIKINPKSFRSTIHFMQNDFSGLSSVTPEKRKGILKDALNLAVYSKLEKIAKEKAAALAKDIDRHKILVENLGTPDLDLNDLNNQFLVSDKILLEKNLDLSNLNIEISKINDKIGELTIAASNIDAKFSELFSKEKNLLIDKSRLDSLINEFSVKKSNMVSAAKDIIEQIKLLKAQHEKLIIIDFSQIKGLLDQISLKKDELANHNIMIKNYIKEYEDLKIPMPLDSVCKNCRQSLSEKHRKECKDKDDNRIIELQKEMQASKKAIVEINAYISQQQTIVNEFNVSKQQLDSVNMKIASKDKELQDKKSQHQEYSEILVKFSLELDEKIKELDVVSLELKASAINDSIDIKIKIEDEKVKLSSFMAIVNSLTKEITHYSNNKAILQHNISQKTFDKSKKEEHKNALVILENKYATYPAVLKAFSSAGIPNLIIQNVLDDLQLEANSLLSQLKPGLQLSFLIEKTNGDGDQADTLDINYQINGKDRFYEQLSGAQKLAVTFSLKLGLSFLLQKMIGTDIKFLLLDEIDQSLDKASVDAFADIIKFFQKDFTILIITHNDRLKDKFNHAILVDQDSGMVSNAHVVSSW